MCGIHHGPFAHLKSSVASSYIQYFETSAAAELFDFQSSNAAVSQHYAAALRIIATAGVKIVYVGSVDDQVVPLYSALHWSASHPSILRALYIDGTTFARTDFLTNLLVFCTAVRNSGLTDHGLLTLLSASVAGSLYGGMGHSRVYEEKATYDLACRYLFETTHPCSEPTTIAGQEPPVLKVEPFTAQQRQNPYSLPWALRGIFEDAEVKALFEQDMRKLLDDYEDWNPVTKTLKDVQWRLEPMRGFPRTDREGKTQPQRKGQSGTQSPNLAGQDHPAASGAKL